VKGYQTARITAAVYVAGFQMAAMGGYQTAAIEYHNNSCTKISPSQKQRRIQESRAF
jgi:hypothetical protein